MSQILSKIAAPPACHATSADWCEEVLIGSFRAFGRQSGHVVNIKLANRIASAAEADEIDELAGFDLLISKLQALHSTCFIFDISRITEIDHAALCHFLGARSVLESKGGRVVLTGSPSSDDTFLAFLLTLLPHFPNAGEALRFLESHEYFFANPDTAAPVTDSGRPERADAGGRSFDDSAEAEAIGDDIFQYYSLAGC